MSLTRLRSRDDLLAVTGGGDAFARLDPAPELTGWAHNRAVALMRASAGRPASLFAWGPQVGALLDALHTAGIVSASGVAGVSVPQGDAAEVQARFAVTGGGDWEWMWTSRRVSPVAAPAPFVDLDDTRDAREIAAFAAVENPRFEGFPGTGLSERWLGVRDEAGALVACGAVQRTPAGTAHLAGVLVADGQRGRGLGRAISGALTDAVVAEEGVCTLGVYSDNTVARTLYESLGYATDKAWASRSITPLR